MNARTSRPLARIALALAALAALTPAHALFKVVGPDGRVTYTDRPPAEGKIQPISKDGRTPSAAEAQLPYALRQVMARFPVTLFTADDCGDACAQARSYLSRRGVPYAERIAASAEDRSAWATLVGGDQAPVLKVGSQSLRTFNPGTWDETLDTAGYPRTSQLPPNYQAPAAVPLTERKPAPKPAPAPIALPPPDSGPAGVRF